MTGTAVLLLVAVVIVVVARMAISFLSPGPEGRRPARRERGIQLVVMLVALVVTVLVLQLG